MGVVIRLVVSEACPPINLSRRAIPQKGRNGAGEGLSWTICGFLSESSLKPIHEVDTLRGGEFILAGLRELKADPAGQRSEQVSVSV